MTSDIGDIIYLAEANTTSTTYYISSIAVRKHLKKDTIKNVDIKAIAVCVVLEQR